MESFNTLLNTIDGWVWGLPLIILLVGTGLWLTLVLRFVQFRKLGHALYLAFIKRKEEGSEPGDITHFQALMTAMSATVGTGNIAGVATAIAAGGPGALFWMWITGLVGMATKYAEAVLAVHYRVVDENGDMAGGPMYYISRGLKLPWLATLFAIFTAAAAFGIGNLTQINSMAEALHETFEVNHTVTGVVCTVMTALVVFGGIRSIGKVTSVIVPLMIVFYVGAAGYILIVNIGEIPAALSLIIKSAFTGHAAAGGFLGSSVMMAIRLGVSRGIFSNESGLGSAPIAAAAAQTKSPITQALVSMTQTFIDTLVVCTMTGLVIVVTNAWTMLDPKTNAGLSGARLTTRAFDMGMPYGGVIVTIGLLFFAYSTILGWSYYGERAMNYLFGTKLMIPYRAAFVAVILVGALSQLKTVWTISDILNGLMAFPNLVGLLLLTPVVVRETQNYFAANTMDLVKDLESLSPGAAGLLRALGAPAQPVVREHQGGHRLRHRHEARQEAGIVAPARLDLRRLVGPVHRLLGAAEAGGRLHRRPQHDRHAGGDPPQDAAVVVRGGAHALRTGQEGVVVGAPPQLGRGEAGAELHPGHRRDRKQRVPERGLQPVEDRLAQPRGQPAHDQLCDPADRISIPARGLDQRLHPRGRGGVGAAARVEAAVGAPLHLVERDRRGIGELGLHLAHLLHVADDLGAELGLEQGLGDRPGGDPGGGLAGAGAAAAPVVAAAVFLVVAEVCVSRPVGLGDLAVVLGAGVLVSDQDRDRRAGGLAFKEPGQDLGLVGLLALRDQPALARSPAVELGLDQRFGDGEPGRTAIEDGDEPGAVGLPGGGEAERLAQLVSRHMGGEPSEDSGETQ